MQMLKRIVQPLIVEALSNMGVEQMPIEKMLQASRELDQGDLALPCFPFAKRLGMAPAEIAEQLAHHVADHPAIGGVSGVNGYLNIRANPTWIVEQYNLKELALNGYVHLEMRRAVWGLPQAGILANKRLRRKLAPFGYYECVNTPGLWYHVSRPISFTLVVDDFGVKFVGKEHADHLIASIKSTYKKLTEDWTGSLYCGISLDWDYVGRTVDISMPGYIKKKLQEYQHTLARRVQNCPYSPDPKRFGVDAQAPIELDATAELDAKGIKRIQQIVGSILYYAHAVDMTVLMALSSIAVEQTKATEKTLGRCLQLLDYLASNSEAKVRYHASDMIMNIHSDASYLSETKARSRACGHFFMGWMPKNGEPIKLNGAFYINTTILRFVVASAAEAELGALFHNCQDGIIFRQTLTNLGHPQPKTPVHCDNATAVGIVNNTVK